MDLKQTNVLFGQDSIFKYSPEYNTYKDSILTRGFRTINSHTFNTVSDNLNVKNYYTFETKLEHFTPLKEMCLIASFKFEPNDWPAPWFNVAAFPQPPFFLSQFLFDVKIKINDVNITSTDGVWSCLPAFLFPIPRERESFYSKCGHPYQKLQQEGGVFSTGVTSAPVLPLDATSENFACLYTDRQNNVQIPLFHYSNFFNQDYALPPGVRINISFTFSGGTAFKPSKNNIPGVVYNTLPAGITLETFDILKPTFLLGMFYYKMTDAYKESFIKKWKREPINIRFNDLVLAPFLSNISDGTKIDYFCRIEVNQFTNSALFFFVSPPYKNPSGREKLFLDFYSNGRSWEMAFPNVTAPLGGNMLEQAKLTIYPFAITKLVIYNETLNERVLDLSSELQDKEFIHYYLQEKTREYFKRSEKDLSINRSDVYMQRAAPYIIPLNHEALLNQTSGPLPRKVSYLIQYSVNSLVTTDTTGTAPLPAGLAHYFFHLENRIVRIDSDNTTRIINSEDLITSTINKQNDY
jgi:hypothetical protein